MDVICIATIDGRGYYSILRRMRLTGLAFRSCTPSEIIRDDCALILTTARELKTIKGNAVAIEEFDDSPAIMKAQLIAKMKKGDRELLVGIDPGSRIGFAVFYQKVKLTSMTLDSTGELLNVLHDMIRKIPHSKIIIKVGGGAPKLSLPLARSVRNRFVDAIVEIVDESGTSNSSRQGKLTRDQLAAVRIAYRKGVLLLADFNKLR